MSDANSKQTDSHDDRDREPLDFSDSIVDEGWAALDHLLSRHVLRLSHEQLQRVADGVRRRTTPPRARRPRRRWAIVAASVVVGVAGLSWMLKLPQEASRTAIVQQAATSESIVDSQLDLTMQSNDIAWDDDWSTAVASASQHFDDVEADWGDSEQTWMGLQVQMNHLEDELSTAPSL